MRRLEGPTALAGAQSVCTKLTGSFNVSDRNHARCVVLFSGRLMYLQAEAPQIAQN
jgi:hypothetical protein